MKPPPFEYFEPSSLDEALELFGSLGADAKVLAGGQSLLTMLNFRLVRPSALVGLNRIPSLTGLRERDGHLIMGAMTRQCEVERSDLVRARWPLLVEAVRFVGHPQIRARGTIGGSLAHADPAAELPAVVTVLGGTLVVRDRRGERQLRPEQFFRGLMSTALAPDEILVEVHLPPLLPGTGWAFLEMSRRHGDFALAGIAATVRLGPDERCQEAVLALTGVGPGPVTVPTAVAALVGTGLDEGALDRAAEAVKHVVHPDSDLHASAGYRREVAAVLTRRALRRAHERAGRSHP